MALSERCAIYSADEENSDAGTSLREFSMTMLILQLLILFNRCSSDYQVVWCLYALIFWLTIFFVASSSKSSVQFQ